jgi:hypothetical protein
MVGLYHWPVDLFTCRPETTCVFGFVGATLRMSRAPSDIQRRVGSIRVLARGRFDLGSTHA